MHYLSPRAVLSPAYSKLGGPPSCPGKMNPSSLSPDSPAAHIPHSAPSSRAALHLILPRARQQPLPAATSPHLQSRPPGAASSQPTNTYRALLMCPSWGTLQKTRQTKPDFKQVLVSRVFQGLPGKQCFLLLSVSYFSSISNRCSLKKNCFLLIKMVTWAKWLASSHNHTKITTKT